MGQPIDHARRISRLYSSQVHPRPSCVASEAGNVNLIQGTEIQMSIELITPKNNGYPYCSFLNQK